MHTWEYSSPQKNRKVIHPCFWWESKLTVHFFWEHYRDKIFAHDHFIDRNRHQPMTPHQTLTPFICTQPALKLYKMVKHHIQTETIDLKHRQPALELYIYHIYTINKPSIRHKSQLFFGSKIQRGPGRSCGRTAVARDARPLSSGRGEPSSVMVLNGLSWDLEVS